MGRRAIHLTAEAKKAAKRAQAQNYRRSAKGKATKSRSNRRYYERQMDARDTERSLAALEVEIPSDLFARAHGCTLRPCLAVADYGPLLWPPPHRFFQPPTYMLDAMPWPPASSASGKWESRAAVLGSYQWREMIGRCGARMARWTTEPADILHREVTVEVFKRVAGWCALRDTELDVEEEEEYVREVALDWGAKLTSMLVEEWECRTRDGLKGYQEAGKAKRLPWQRFVTQTEQLYKSEARY
ncbi:hypothetical protein K466DRAFT_605591 [Polyporus arcularius HHB13444]|uniref:Uncharacterized protein n=1 Tax=Polyporus arcularius HHB13444 TaxID=1314778 RepID=A0A5C3NUV9_9APHY|nr:hypothetical protein K466DRAFT_605591 [Polyporus arcularius HHB13444]